MPPASVEFGDVLATRSCCGLPACFALDCVGLKRKDLTLNVFRVKQSSRIPAWDRGFPFQSEKCFILLGNLCWTSVLSESKHDRISPLPNETSFYGSNVWGIHCWRRGSHCRALSQISSTLPLLMCEFVQACQICRIVLTKLLGWAWLCFPWAWESRMIFYVESLKRADWCSSELAENTVVLWSQLLEGPGRSIFFKYFRK